jgi:quercetin dioxygenase-like cupin family protein
MTTTANHKPDPATFVSILSEDIAWEPYPGLPPQVRRGTLVGDFTLSEPYVLRVRVPHGTKIAPHRHPEDRVYTVMSGVFYIGHSETFDPPGLVAYPPGSVVVVPRDTPHFHWAKSSEYITQITAVGPTGVEFVNPADDAGNAP